VEREENERESIKAEPTVTSAPLLGASYGARNEDQNENQREEGTEYREDASIEAGDIQEIRDTALRARKRREKRPGGERQELKGRKENFLRRER